MCSRGVAEEEIASIFRVALALLTAEPVGSFHIHEQDVEATTDYVKRGE